MTAVNELAALPPLRVGFDLDGVVYDFDRAVARWFHLAYGIPLTQMPRPDRWNTWECWNMDKADWLAKANEGVDAGYIFGEGPPERDAVFVHNQVLQRGHTTHVITARCSMGRPRTGMLAASAEVNTRHWLRSVHLHPSTLDFSADKTIRPLDVMIEDNLDNYDALDAAGVHVVLMDRPWNQDEGMRRRVYSMPQYLQVVDHVDYSRRHAPVPA